MDWLALLGARLKLDGEELLEIRLRRDGCKTLDVLDVLEGKGEEAPGRRSWSTAG